MSRHFKPTPSKTQLEVRRRQWDIVRQCRGLVPRIIRPEWYAHEYRSIAEFTPRSLIHNGKKARSQ